MEQNPTSKVPTKGYMVLSKTNLRKMLKSIEGRGGHRTKVFMIDIHHDFVSKDGSVQLSPEINDIL